MSCQNCFQLGLNCCFPIFDNGESHIPCHLWLDFRLPSHLTMGCHFCQNSHIPMTQLLLILRQKGLYPSLYFFLYKTQCHTHSWHRANNVAYIGAARRSYNASKKTGVFSRLQQIYYFPLTTVMARIVMLQGIKVDWITEWLFTAFVRCQVVQL